MHLIQLALTPASPVLVFIGEQLRNGMPLSESARTLLLAGRASVSVISRQPSGLLASADPRWSLSTADPSAVVTLAHAADYLLEQLAGGVTDTMVVEFPWNRAGDLDLALRAKTKQEGQGIVLVLPVAEHGLARAAIGEAQGYPGGILFGILKDKGPTVAFDVCAIPAFDHESFLIMRPSNHVRTVG